MGNLLQDFVYAGRMLRKSPAFSLVAVLSLSVGIAANTTIFSVINAVLLRPLPHNDPGRLVEQLLYNYLSPGRFYVRLLGLFGAIALILAAIGIYGVLSCSVSQRRHEIGIRMALGANRADVVRLVLMQGLKLTAAGVAAGIAGALALRRFIVSALYGVTPSDSSTFAIVSLFLAAGALLASYLPARRAMQEDPVKVLRGQ